MDYSHSLRVGGLRYVLLRVNSQVCLTRLILNFHFFFPWIMNQILTLLECLSRKRRGIPDEEIGWNLRGLKKINRELKLFRSRFSPLSSSYFFVSLHFVNRSFTMCIRVDNQVLCSKRNITNSTRIITTNFPLKNKMRLLTVHWLIRLVRACVLYEEEINWFCTAQGTFIEIEKIWLWRKFD